VSARDVVGIGASAGGLPALLQLAAGLPAGLLVVMHSPRESPSHLPRPLGRAGPLPAAHAVDGVALLARAYEERAVEPERQAMLLRIVLTDKRGPGQESPFGRGRTRRPGR
jgi:two-component system chemotaxis response regulator CheB